MPFKGRESKMKQLKKGLAFALVACMLVLTAPVWALESYTGPVAITNVRVFDGDQLSEPRTVVFENGVITNATTAPTAIDGEGGVLLPGLIDSHVHLEGEISMEHAAQWGVTVMLDMGTPVAVADKLRNLPHLPDILCSGVSAAPPGGTHAAMGCIPVATPREAEAFVADRVAEKVDFIKVIADSPAGQNVISMDEQALAALVTAAHDNNLAVVAHVTLDTSFNACFRTDVDIVTHTPLAMSIDAEMATKLKKKNMAAIPTLIMMQCFMGKIPAGAQPPGLGYDNAEESVTAMNKAGVLIMAGTDANSTVCATPHGESLHTELELLVDAGLTPIEALRSATVLPAAYFGFSDRGVIKPGYRADMVLVKGDPTTDISATQNIMGVWIKGVRVK